MLLLVFVIMLMLGLFCSILFCFDLVAGFKALVGVCGNASAGLV